MNVWKKRLIMFCIGLAMGSAGTHFYKGNIAAGIGFVVAAIYAIGWRIECGLVEYERESTKMWKDVADADFRKMWKETEKSNDNH